MNIKKDFFKLKLNVLFEKLLQYPIKYIQMFNMETNRHNSFICAKTNWETYLGQNAYERMSKAGFLTSPIIYI